MNGITYYTVSYHMRPIAHFQDYGEAVRFASAERKRRLNALDSIDPPMTQGEKRGEITSIKYGVAVRKVKIDFADSKTDPDFKFD
tara:strand:+ start:771 stop:1025 length:255 start_codon:yes stop_codon:yes gene_type:complete